MGNHPLKVEQSQEIKQHSLELWQSVTHVDPLPASDYLNGRSTEG